MHSEIVRRMQEQCNMQLQAMQAQFAEREKLMAQSIQAFANQT